jgi:hypothetical protein
MSAEWRPIPSYEGLYEVSNQGDVRSLDRVIRRENILQPLKGKLLAPCLNKKTGYLHVSLCSQGKQRSYHVHALVASAFIGPCPAGQEVRHDDGVRTHNEASNLLYGTRRENIHDKHRHGTTHRGEQIASAKLKKQDVLEIRRHIKDGKTLAYMAGIYGVSNGAIQSIRDGKTWAHLGPIERHQDQPNRPVPARREAAQ